MTGFSFTVDMRTTPNESKIRFGELNGILENIIFLIQVFQIF